jgi:gluconokinase
MAKAIILMGVSGSGKTSVGKALSDALGWPFYDGDGFHPQENVDKMATGIPLNDEDRQPWLERLHELLYEHLQANRSLVLACSALKMRYRAVLKGELNGIEFVHLAGSFDLIYPRIQNRSGHYMRAGMLRSQFRDLEAPVDGLTISVDQPIGAIIKKVIAELDLR